jgi:hypothetical protein
MNDRHRQRVGRRRGGHEEQHQQSYPDFSSTSPMDRNHPLLNINYYAQQQQHHYSNDYNVVEDDDEDDDDRGNGSGGRQPQQLFSTIQFMPPSIHSQTYHTAGMLTLLILLVATAWGYSTLLYSTWNIAVRIIPGLSYLTTTARRTRRSRGLSSTTTDSGEDEIPRPHFVYEHPYVSSSYYTSTKSIQTLKSNEEIQVRKNLLLAAEEEALLAAGKKKRPMKTRLAIVRPFCEFDAEALPSTFSCWNGLSPCKAAREDIGGGDDEYDDYDDEEGGSSYELTLDGELKMASYKSNRTTLGTGDGYDDEEEDRHLFDFVGSDAMKNAVADVFLFYSQTFSENEVAIKAVDTIIDQFFEPGGWSQCFGNIYAIEANIPQELDLYIPSAQEELYNWVNGPNRQYEAAFRIIQSGEWGEYDGFYLMEGDSVPIKAHWLDVVLSEIEKNRPFAVLGA